MQKQWSHPPLRENRSTKSSHVSRESSFVMKADLELIESAITSGSDCAHRCTLFSCDACMPRFCALQRRSALYAVDGAFSTRAFPLLSVAQRRQKIAPYVSAGKADHTTASPFRTARTPRPLTLDKRHAVRRDTLYSPPTLNRNPARKLIPSAGYPTTSSYC